MEHVAVLLHAGSAARNEYLLLTPGLRGIDVRGLLGLIAVINIW